MADEPYSTWDDADNAEATDNAENAALEREMALEAALAGAAAASSFGELRPGEIRPPSTVDPDQLVEQTNSAGKVNSVTIGKMLEKGKITKICINSSYGFESWTLAHGGVKVTVIIKDECESSGDFNRLYTAWMGCHCQACGDSGTLTDEQMVMLKARRLESSPKKSVYIDGKGWSSEP